MSVWSCRFSFLSFALFLLAAGGCGVPSMNESRMAEAVRYRVAPASFPSGRSSAAEVFHLDTGGEAVSGVLTLRKVVETALKNSPMVRIAQLQREAARHRKVVARSLFLPLLELSGGYFMRDRPVEQKFGAMVVPVADKEFYTVELSLRTVLWDFGRSMGRYRAASEAVKVAELMLERQRQDVAFTAAAAYVGYLHAVKRVEVARAAVKAARSHVDTAKALFDAGVVKKSDLLRVELQRSCMEQLLASCERAREVAAYALCFAMGVGMKADVAVAVVTPSLDVPSLESMLVTALKHRPDLAAAERMLRMKMMEWKAAEAEKRPVFFLQTKATRLDDEYQYHKNSFVAGIGMRIPLFEGGRLSASAGIARTEMEEAVQKLRLVCDSVSLEVRKALARLHDAVDRMRVQREACRYALENLRMVENRYANGAALVTELVDAQAADLRARMEYELAKADVLLGLERLKYVTGVNVGSKQ